MTTSAARSLKQLAAKFKAEFKKDLVANYGYRSYNDQVKVFKANYDFTPRAGNTYANGGIKWWQGRAWHKKSGKAVAAQPGFSNHGWGTAIDFGGLKSFTSAEYLWLAKNAPYYGWTNTEGKSIREYWHWVYNINQDKSRITKVSLKITGNFDTATQKEWQRQLGNLKVDGDFGSDSVKRLKVRLNAKDGHGGFELTGGKLSTTGTLDARTIKAVQKLINIWYERGEITLTSGPLAVDGKFGTRTVKALQKTLNEGLWD